MLVPRSHPQIPSWVTHPAFLRGRAATENISYSHPFCSYCLMKSSFKQKGISLFSPSSDEELPSHILPLKTDVGQPSSKFFMLSFCCVTGLERVCIQTSPWFWVLCEKLHDGLSWNLHRWCLTDRAVASGREVMHVIRVLLCGAHYLISPLPWLRQEGGWHSLLHFLYSRMIKTPCGAYYQPYHGSARLWEKQVHEELVNAQRRVQWEWEVEEECPRENRSKQSSEDTEAKFSP